MRARLLFALAASVSLAPGLAFVPACSSDMSASSGPPVELHGVEASVRVDLSPFVIRVIDGEGKEILTTLPGGDGDPYGGPGATRDMGSENVMPLPGWDGWIADERPWRRPSSAVTVAQSDRGATFELDAGDGNAIVVDVLLDGAKVHLKTTARFADPASPEVWNKTSIAFALRPDEHFFGLGERFASVDHRGLSLYSWAEEGGLGQGEDQPRGPQNPSPNGPSMTYFPVPFFLSSAGYAVHLPTTFRTETHLGSERDDAYRIAASTTSLETIVYVHDDPAASLEHFTRDTGRSMIPAPWAFGPVRRVSFDNQVNGVDEWTVLRQRKVPTTILDDATHILPARSEVGREGVLSSWIQRVHAAGYKVVAYNNPYVAFGKDGSKQDADFGAANGLFAKTPEGAVGKTTFISGELLDLATIDLTQAAAVAWFQDLLGHTLALGYDGWMHDFGEYVQRPWRFGDGRLGEEVHNIFPVLSAKAAHDLMEKQRPGDYLFYVRSGYTGSQQYAPMVWSGDPEATFDVTQGLPAQVRGGLNLGMSGVALWGSDVSGFKCITDFPHDKEMYLRWAEFGAVSPFMLEENACANPLFDRSKWKLWDDDETVTVYGAMARLHTRLLPYFEVLAREANQTGMPIMRHPFLYHPHEPAVWAVDDAYYLGASLYTSPVVSRGATSKSTWFPPGRWVDFDDHTVVEGGGAHVTPAPLDKLPLFVRDGGIVPMLDPSIETLAVSTADTDPAVVTLDRVRDRLDVIVALAPGQDAHIVLADGTELTARRKSSAGPASGLAVVDPAAVSTCSDGCVAQGPDGDVDRVRLTTPLGTSSSVAHEDLELVVDKGATSRRVRWDVLRLR
ncbi:TIM-barrel domain-containing protein [Labilithrix luteola]|uniref:TIM-barrel domain-containing protein n=1 Tax=Labilithrix luteola TaxID=1391654 RepID=UPI0011BACA47|nr:TIM-barrel domain-containing protein [Labilithrix luteola]